MMRWLLAGALSLVPVAVTADPITIGVAIGAGASAFALGVSVTAAIAIGVGTALLSNYLTPKIPGAQPSPPLDQTIRGTNVPRRIVYGKRLLAGSLFFAKTSSDNEYLYMALAVAGHEVNSIGDLVFNDKPQTDFDSDYWRITKYLGTSSQTADANFVSELTEWTTNHRARGIAYLAVRLKGSREVWPNGVPNIRAWVEGKKVYDPRTDTTAYSTNPALCIRDYLLTDASVGGFGADADEVSDTLFIAAANVCDETVTVPNGAGGTTPQPRYTLNGVIDTAQNPADILESMLQTCAGALLYVNGQYELHAGKYDVPEHTITDIWLRDAISARMNTERKSLYNAVRGTFYDVNENNLEVDFVPQESATYAAADGEVIWKDVQMPFTTDAYEAQRLAKLILNKSRRGKVVELKLKPHGLNIKPWDTVTLEFEHAPAMNGVYRVESWTMATDGGIGVDVTLRDEATTDYAWSIDDATEVEYSDDIANADVRTPATPTNLVVADVSDDGAANNQAVNLTWDDVGVDYLDRYLVQYKVSSDSAYIRAGVIPIEADTDPEIRISGLVSGKAYDFRVRTAARTTNVYSAWATATHTVSSAEPPDEPTNLNTSAISGSIIQVYWTQVTDTKVVYYRVEYKVSTDTEYLAGFVVAELSGGQLTGLSSSTTYDIRLRAEYATGEASDWVTTQDSTP
jgi:hypothetical protein